jgi:hypothetical protein
MVFGKERWKCIGDRVKQKKLEERKKTGPKAERLKLRGDWQALVGKALGKKRPKKGWPKA